MATAIFHHIVARIMNLMKNGCRPLPPRCRLPTRSPQFEATVERRQRWAWRRRWMAARRRTTIAHALSMLPPAARVVGSSRRRSGTLRAGADQGAGGGLQHGVVRQVGDASVAGLCHGWDRSSTCINEACQSQKHRHAPFAANFAAGPGGPPHLILTSQRAQSYKPISFEPLPLEGFFLRLRESTPQPSS